MIYRSWSYLCGTARCNYNIRPLPYIPKESKATKASDLIETTPKIQPAVTYVLGDTAIAESRSEAFILSLQGIRVVSHNGDLFEPDGGIQIGDYRSTSEWFPDIINLKKLYEKLESNLPKGVKLGAIKVTEQPGCRAKFGL